MAAPSKTDLGRLFSQVQENIKVLEYSCRVHQETWYIFTRHVPQVTVKLERIADSNAGAEYSDIHAAFQRYFHGAKSDWTEFENEENDRKRKQKNSVITWISASGKMQRLQEKFRSMAICPNSGRWLSRNYSAIAEWMGEEEPPDSAIWLHGNFGYGGCLVVPR
jgi:hypothetical protein